LDPQVLDTNKDGEVQKQEMLGLGLTGFADATQFQVRRCRQCCMPQCTLPLTTKPIGNDH
jgi:hypothetical protein